jgi:hypothetical protein
MAQNPANPQLVGHQQEPTTYHEFYDGMPDSYTQRRVRRIPGAFRTGVRCAQPATLRDRIILAAANHVPKVFAIVQKAPVPHIIFVHRLTRYAPSWLGAQPWDDSIFGFQGDLHPGNQINTIEWPVTPFAWTVHTTVPTLDHMDAAWATAIGDDVLGPFNVNEDPDTEQELRARLLCPVPHRYVPMYLCASDVAGTRHGHFGQMSSAKLARTNR